MESATACVLDGTNEMFLVRAGRQLAPKAGTKRTSGLNTPCHCDARTELVKFPHCLQFIVFI
jgi:hypothetical protein